jgi:hypothetical protein
MKKRVVTKIGDIFSVNVDKKIKKFFQLIAFDLTQLNSDVIRSFKKEYPTNAVPNLAEIVTGQVEFYAHCVTKWGVKLDYWEKVGNSLDVGNIDHILFRDTPDYGVKYGEEPIRTSYRWYVWHIGDSDFTRVGKLEGENRKAEIGLVINPQSIVHRMRTGKFDLPNYPGFE